MTNKIKNSITYKILLSFILLSAFLTVITTVITTRMGYRNEIKKIQKELDNIERSFLPVIKQSLWEVNEDGIKISLNGLVLLPNIEYVEIKQNNRVIASAGVRQSKESISREFPLYYDSAGKKIHLGAVHISVGMKNIYANLYKRALINLSSHGLEILTVSIGMFLIVNFFVIRHLKTIADYFRHMELGGLSKHLILKGHPVFDENVDEVSQIVNAVNAMNAKIKKFITELETEIERRKQADIATCESEGKFKSLSQEFNALLNAIPDTLILLSPDMKVIWANQGAAAGLGKDLSELMGQSCYSLWHQRTAICAGCPSEKSFQSGEIENKTILSPDGRLWDLRAVPIKDAEGKVISVIEVTRDITEHRKLEAQLQQSQKMEAVGTLTGGIAHDFNNILTAIIGYGNILKMKLQENSPLMGYTDQILASADRAANLTQSLLAFSRKQVINPKPVNLNEITASVEKILLRII
ncbi:MAG: PAS domain-containing protein, partial [Nitrospirae bacterium]|nr:PAS domain-containing protein [Nitrospirota bacterium]